MDQSRHCASSPKPPQLGNLGLPRLGFYRKASSHSTSFSRVGIQTDCRSLCISAWTGAASLLSLGLTVPQTIGLMVIARILMVALIIGNGWIGGEWHIGFAVHQRMILGMRGAYITQAMRIMLFIVWYGSQAWLGGLCVSAMISSWSSSFLNMENTFAASANMVTRDFIGFLLFHLISVPFLVGQSPTLMIKRDAHNSSSSALKIRSPMSSLRT